MAYLKTIGCKRFIMPSIAFGNKEELDHSIELINEYAPRLAAEGMEMMYHNHSSEFYYNADGQIPEVEIINRTDIKLQIDVYWIYRAGVNPIYFLEQFKDRIGAVHLKDGTMEHGTPLGQGTAPIAEVVKWTKKTMYLWWLKTNLLPISR